jgi:1-deoxy-D-xylulose-5-phosphate synthase
MSSSYLDHDDAGEASGSADVLDRIRGPRDLRGLSRDELTKLADAIRAFLIEKVSVSGGHLGPNLGVVELTIALHRVFDSPRDALIFDTGHQAYPHKLLTGRKDDFDHLRASGGLSGYPSRAESEHDWVESSHASAALSYADGLAKAFELDDSHDRRVVAIVGDGALTGGMCWEAINNIAAGKNRHVIVVVNDNGRSYAPTIGGLADHLSSLRMRPGYERFLASVKRKLTKMPLLGRFSYSVLHAVKEGLKDALSPQMLFADLGIKYLGPIDGHDIFALEKALRMAKDVGGPVVVHAVTRKGMGYRPAEEDSADCMHAVRSILKLANRSHPPTLHSGRTSLPLSCSDGAGAATTSSRSPPRCRDRPVWRRSERGFRTGCSMWGSPSNTLLHPLRAWRLAACTRWSLCTLRSSTGPSTRSSWMSHC